MQKLVIELTLTPKGVVVLSSLLRTGAKLWTIAKGASNIVYGNFLFDHGDVIEGRCFPKETGVVDDGSGIGELVTL